MAITALCPLLGGSGLLCVGSADACITVYDIATQVKLIIIKSNINTYNNQVRYADAGCDWPLSEFGECAHRDGVFLPQAVLSFH